MTSIASKLDIAHELKVAGNDLFKRGLYKKAIIKYNTVFAYINGLDNNINGLNQYHKALNRECPTESQRRVMTQLRISTLSNLAICYLKLPSTAEKALDACDKILALDPQHAKATFRKAMALRALCKEDEAMELLQSLGTSDVAVTRALREMQAMSKERREKEKEVYKNMFKTESSTKR